MPSNFFSSLLLDTAFQGYFYIASLFMLGITLALTRHKSMQVVKAAVYVGACVVFTFILGMPGSIFLAPKWAKDTLHVTNLASLHSKDAREICMQKAIESVGDTTLTTTNIYSIVNAKKANKAVCETIYNQRLAQIQKIRKDVLDSNGTVSITSLSTKIDSVFASNLQ